MSTSHPTVMVPVLPVRDLVRSLAWYERLGFTLRSEHPGYAILAFDGAEVHLAEFDAIPPADESFSGAYLRVADADAVHAHWSAMGAPTIAPPEDQPYGIREFATEDVDGNLWRVGAVIAGGLADVWKPVGETPFAAAGDEPPVWEDELAAASISTADEAPDTADPSPASVASGDAVVTGHAPGPDEPAGTPPGEPATLILDGSAGTTDDAWYGLMAEDVRCAGCGFQPGELHERALGAEVRDVVHSFGELLATADDDAVRRHPADGSWSALEYGVHVRDLLAVFAERIIRTLAETEPALGWWDHEAAIADGMANESDVGAVVDDLGRNASKLSEALRLVSDEDWERGATRRDGERFTIELMARFALHEVIHHRTDAQRALAAAAPS